jgi:hypothetical protein
MHADAAITEARARIIWGESSRSVRDFLVSNGISDAEADAKIREFSLERNAEIRGLGLKSVLVGMALIGAAGVMFWVRIRLINNGILYIGLAKYYAVVGVAGLYGMWRLAKGIFYLVRPQSERRSIPDMTE